MIIRPVHVALLLVQFRLYRVPRRGCVEVALHQALHQNLAEHMSGVACLLQWDKVTVGCAIKAAIMPDPSYCACWPAVHQRERRNAVLLFVMMPQLYLENSRIYP